MNMKTDSQPETPTNQSFQKSRHYTFVSHNPIHVRVNLENNLTSKDGRRSKFAPLEGEAAKVRERSRARNGKSAHRLKEKRLALEKHLCDVIDVWETRVKYLEQEIQNRRSYKALLERRIQQLMTPREQTIPDNSTYPTHSEMDTACCPQFEESKLHFDD